MIALQETKVSSCSQEVRTTGAGRFTFFFSSTARREANARGRLLEHHGVGFIVGPKLGDYILDCVPHNSRIIEIKFGNHGSNMRFVNQYAPRSRRPSEEKHAHWEYIQELIHSQPRQIPTFILGDANARLHGRTCLEEEQITGPHIFGLGNHHVPSLPDEQAENRQCLVDVCIANKYFISITRFKKTSSKRCTFKEATTEGFIAPWTPDRFAQLDFILSPEEYTNAVLNVEARTDIAFNTDHAMVVATIRLKPKAKHALKQNTVERYRTPTPEQLLAYNEEVGKRGPSPRVRLS